MQNVLSLLMHTSPLLIYSVVAIILLLESTGVPLTNTTLLLFTGAIASLGYVNIWVLLMAACIGSVVGACSAYVIGARGGHTILVRVAAFFRVDAQRVIMVERWCTKSGWWMVFISRMTPYARPIGCFPAGISQMNFVQFLGAASLGSLIWCSVLLALGWSLGRRWMLALSIMQHYTLPVIGLLVVLVALYILGTQAIKRRLNQSQQQLHNAALSATTNIPKHDLVEV